MTDDQSTTSLPEREQLEQQATDPAPTRRRQYGAGNPRAVAGNPEMRAAALVPKNGAR
jgi:hypothetical protein